MWTTTEGARVVQHAMPSHAKLLAVYCWQAHHVRIVVAALSPAPVGRVPRQPLLWAATYLEVYCSMSRDAVP